MPTSGRSSPAIILINVVFPEPLDPMSEKISPGEIEKLTLSTASFLLKRLVRFSRLSIFFGTLRKRVYPYCIKEHGLKKVKNSVSQYTVGVYSVFCKRVCGTRGGDGIDTCH